MRRQFRAQISGQVALTSALPVDDGARGIVEMLFCTSLIALVGAADQPQSSPRKLQIVNTKVCSLPVLKLPISPKLERFYDLRAPFPVIHPRRQAEPEDIGHRP